MHNLEEIHCLRVGPLWHCLIHERYTVQALQGGHILHLATVDESGLSAGLGDYRHGEKDLWELALSKSVLSKV